MGFGWTIDDVRERVEPNKDSPLYAMVAQFEAAMSPQRSSVVASMGGDIFNDVVAAIDPTSTIPAVHRGDGVKYQPPKAPAPAAEISYDVHSTNHMMLDPDAAPMWKNPLVIGGVVLVAYIVLKRI